MKIISFDVWLRYFGWNFIGYLWNSTKISYQANVVIIMAVSALQTTIQGAISVERNNWIFMWCFSTRALFVIKHDCLTQSVTGHYHNVVWYTLASLGWYKLTHWGLVLMYASVNWVIIASGNLAMDSRQFSTKPLPAMLLTVCDFDR